MKSTSRQFQPENKSKKYNRPRFVAAMTLVALSGTTVIAAASDDSNRSTLSLSGLPNGEFCLADEECTSNFCDPVEYVCACTQDIHCAPGELCNTMANPNQCTTCGDGLVNPGEACDDGNKVNGDACDNNCTVPACGNGIATPNERCDDGNAADGDGCSASCGIESGWLCSCHVAYGPAQEAGKLGEPAGGDVYSLECFDNQVFMGLAIEWTKNEAGTAIPGTATSIVGTCGTVGPDSLGVLTTTPRSSLYSGGLGCDGWDPSIWSEFVYCPPGQAIVGLQGSNAPMMTGFYTSISIECQAVGLDLVPYGPTTIVPVPNPTGNFPGTPVAFSCAPGTIVKTLETHSSCGQEALVVLCAKPQFDCSFLSSNCDAVCGDGIVISGRETCDDMNRVDGDCCGSACFLEQMDSVCRKSTGPCDPAETCTGTSGTCPADEKAADGASCDDGNACTEADTCQSGSCTAGSPIACTALDQCHEVGVCDSNTGFCSSVVKADGSSCDDGNACTQIDTCNLGVCTGGNNVVCTSENECEEPSTCDSATGQCTHVPKPDGTPCQTTSICFAGKCVSSCNTSADCGPNPDAFECFENRCVRIVAGSSDASCACRTPGAPTSSRDLSDLGMLAGLALLLKRRRMLQFIRIRQ